MTAPHLREHQHTSIADYLALIRRRWRIVAASAVAGIVIAAITTTSMPAPVHEATVRLGVTFDAKRASERFAPAEAQVDAYATLGKRDRVLRRVKKLGLKKSLSSLRKRLSLSTSETTIEVTAADHDRREVARIANVVSAELIKAADTIKVPAKGDGDTAISLVERASMPGSSSFAPAVRRIAFGLVVGLALGAWAAVLREALGARRGS